MTDDRTRLSTIAFVLGLTITASSYPKFLYQRTHLDVALLASPIGNCNLIRYVNFLYPFTLPLGILHFIPRVSAMYLNNKFVVAFFTCSWLGVLAMSILWPFGVQGMKLGPSGYCFEIKLHSTASIHALVLLVHDSLVFLATSWAFIPLSYSTKNAKGMFKVVILGKNLPKFTKSVLRDGQAYYL